MESKKKKGFIVQAFEAPILKFVNIAIIAQAMKSSPKFQVNLFLKLSIAIKIRITKTELLFIGISMIIQQRNFAVKINVKNAVKILVVILF